MLSLVLYDIPSNPPCSSWSPNPAKTRYEDRSSYSIMWFNDRPRFVLSHKNLPFETIWVEYPDIAPKLKEIGAQPNKLPNGTERYTVPVLSDPNTGALITDSWVIAEYLDKTYPEKPVFPNNSLGAINAFDAGLRSLAESTFEPFSLLRTSQMINERSRQYFINVKEAVVGCKVDEWSPEGPKRDAHWVMIENYYVSAKMWYERVEGKWLMGDTFSYADILFAVNSLWFQRVYRDDEWRKIASLHDGKWEKLLADVENECNLS